MEPVFQMKSVCVGQISYPDAAILPGETTWICGESGSGKTTLLRLLNGTREADAGMVFFQGKALAELDWVWLRRHAVLAGQEVFLFDGTIQDNFLRFHKYHGSQPPSVEAIRTYLDICCFPVSPSSECRTLSGGERQRVFLAIAVSMGTEALLLDEPTSALNRDLALELMGRLCQYEKERQAAVIAVTHDERLPAALGGPVIRLGRKGE